MPIITTYVCDVSGKSSQERSDFATVKITAQYRENEKERYDTTHTIEKFIHKEVLKKLGLDLPNPRADAAEQAARPEVSFEAQLKSLLRPWVEEVAQDIVDNQ